MSVTSVRVCSAVQWTDSPGLGVRNLGSRPSSGIVPVVFNKQVAFPRLQL